MKFAKITLIISFIMLFLFACNETKPGNQNTVQNTENKQTPTEKAEVVEDKLATGRKTFKEQCVKCHKEDGTGGEVEIEGKKLNADDLTSDKMKKMSDEKYTKYIVNGIPDEGMPSFKDILNDEEVNEVIKFIREEIQK